MRLHNKTTRTVRRVTEKTFDVYVDVLRATDTETAFGKKNTYAIVYNALPAALIPFSAKELQQDEQTVKDWLRFYVMLPVLYPTDNDRIVIHNLDRMIIRDQDQNILASNLEVQQQTTLHSRNRFVNKVRVTQAQVL